MITDKHVFFDGNEMAKAVTECKQLAADGWTELPDWVPAGLPPYEYRLPGQLFAYMKPKPKLRHILRYKYQPKWWIKYKASRWVKGLFK